MTNEEFAGAEIFLEALKLNQERWLEAIEEHYEKEQESK